MVFTKLEILGSEQTLCPENVKPNNMYTLLTTLPQDILRCLLCKYTSIYLCVKSEIFFKRMEKKRKSYVCYCPFTNISFLRNVHLIAQLVPQWQRKFCPWKKSFSFWNMWVQGSMRKASSLSECWQLRVRRSGRRRSSLGKREASSGRRRVMRERRARIRPSCRCSRALTSAIPSPSGEERGGGGGAGIGRTKQKQSIPIPFVFLFPWQGLHTNHSPIYFLLFSPCSPFI